MSDVLTRCVQTFGTLPPDFLFYHFQHALRFELAGSVEGSIPRFLKAYDRANAVISSLVSEESQVVCLLSYLSESEAPKSKQFAKKALGPLAINPTSIVHLGGHYSADHEAFQHWVQVDPVPDTGVLLWSAIGMDLGIGPNLPGLLYLIDLERRLIIHPYDDRGMDVVAMERDTLLPLYRNFESWLLYYDRERMDAAFGATD